MATTFYRSTKYDPPLLLRRVTAPGKVTDEALLDGEWQPTKIIVDYMFGHDDYVEPVADPSN